MPDVDHTFYRFDPHSRWGRSMEPDTDDSADRCHLRLTPSVARNKNITNTQRQAAIGSNQLGRYVDTSALFHHLPKMRPHCLASLGWRTLFYGIEYLL
jgi:hypothetical protein